MNIVKSIGKVIHFCGKSCFLKHNSVSILAYTEYHHLSSSQLYLGPCSNKQAPMPFSVSKRPASSGKVVINDSSIYYEQCGVGEHVVLMIPGALGSIKTDFSKQLQNMNKEDFTLIGMDPRGYGQSLPPRKSFSFDFLKEDADDAAALMDTLGFSSFSLLGWSDGANVASILAAKYPQKVRRLVVWGGNSFVTPEDLSLYLKVRDVANWSQSMKQPMIDVYGESTFEQMWHAWVDVFVSMPKDANGNVDLYTDDLGRITCETLIIHGEKDAMVPKFHPEHLHKNIKKSRLVCWDDGKHNLHIKFADRFKQLVEAFLLESRSQL